MQTALTNAEYALLTENEKKIKDRFFQTTFLSTELKMIWIK